MKTRVKAPRLYATLFLISGAGLLSFCAHHETLEQNGQQGSDVSAFLPGPASSVNALETRAPATVGRAVPWAPGVVNHSNTPPATHQPAPTPNPAPAQPPVKGGEARGGCPAPLNRIGVGGVNPANYGQPYSVMDLMLAGSRGQSITGSFEGDLRLLQPWFRMNHEPSSDVFASLEQSKAWCRATDFVSGIFSSRCGEMKAADSMINARMAAILVGVLAVRNQPECIKEIRSLAQRILGPNVGELDEALMPLTEAATDLQGGHLQQRFDETLKTRTDLEGQIKAVDAQISAKEKSSHEAMAEAERDLKTSMDALRLGLAKIPPCAATVKFDMVTMDRSQKADSATSTLVNNCKQLLVKKLDIFKKEEAELTAQVSKYAEKHALNPELVVTDQERAVNDKLEERGRLLNLYRGYLQLLEDKADSESVYSQKQKIDALMRTGSQTEAALKNNTYAAKEMQIKADLEKRYQATSGRYLTYGFFGGFGNLPSDRR